MQLLTHLSSWTAVVASMKAAIRLCYWKWLVCVKPAAQSWWWQLCRRRKWWPGDCAVATPNGEVARLHLPSGHETRGRESTCLIGRAWSRDMQLLSRQRLTASITTASAGPALSYLNSDTTQLLALVMFSRNHLLYQTPSSNQAIARSRLGAKAYHGIPKV